MKRNCILLAASLVSIAAAADPVCVVGAGPAGLAAAHKLKEIGENAVIFEKHDRVGGKCQSFYDATYHPLGAILFANGSYPETLKIIDETGVKATVSDRLVPRWTFDWETGAIEEFPEPTQKQKVELLVELARYSLFWHGKFEPISGVGYREKIPEELTVSTSEWLKANNYTGLAALFNTGMFVYGYGDLRQTPILYMLQLFHPRTLAAFAELEKAYIIDYHKVLQEYSKKTAADIRVNATISEINRSQEAPVITYSIGPGGASETQKCKSLILAFPPTTAALEAAKLDLRDEERTLFSSVELTDYFSGAVEMSEDFPAHQVYYAKTETPAQPPDGVGQPVGLVRFFDESPVATTWSWNRIGHNVTKEDARNLLIETLSKINKNPKGGADPVNITDSDVKAFWKFEYFPKVSGENLAGGWYQRFNEQQGKLNTFYASGLNGLETVEFALRAGFDVVSQHVARINKE